MRRFREAVGRYGDRSGGGAGGNRRDELRGGCGNEARRRAVEIELVRRRRFAEVDAANRHAVAHASSGGEGVDFRRGAKDAATDGRLAANRHGDWAADRLVRDAHRQARGGRRIDLGGDAVESDGVVLGIGAEAAAVDADGGFRLTARGRERRDRNGRCLWRPKHRQHHEQAEEIRWDPLEFGSGSLRDRRCRKREPPSGNARPWACMHRISFAEAAG